MWNTPRALQQSYVKLTTLVTLFLTIYKIQSTIIYFVLPFVAVYPHCRVDAHNLLLTFPTHPHLYPTLQTLVYLVNLVVRDCEFYFHLCV